MVGGSSPSESTGEEMEPTRYYYELKDGYDIGDKIVVGIHDYEIIEIDQVNQMMLIEEIEDE